MRDLVAEINRKELDMLDSYINNNALNVGEDDYGDRYISNYGYEHSVPVEQKLAYWSAAKQNLFHLLGNKLIVEKEIEINRAEWELSNEIEETLLDDRFIDLINGANHDGRIIDSSGKALPTERHGYNWWGSYDLHDLCRDHAYCLSTNYWGGRDFICYVKDHESSEYKKIKIQSGSKPIKVLGRIAKYLGYAAEYEDFRLKHSMILNNKKMKGTLCLSIHPMDYLTMSDNSYGWDSCMSWLNGGCYKRGTVEMMNSPWVIVAYLKGTQPFYPLSSNSVTWNSKKWRTLIIANADFIASIKSYPYQHDELTQQIVTWVRELAEESWGNTYQLELSAFEDNYYEPALTDYSIHFSTHTMYNDFGCDTRHYITMRENFNGPTEKASTQPCLSKLWYIYNYSGEDNCMCCGKAHPYGNYYSSSDVFCQDCCTYEEPREYVGDCIYCGDSVYDDEDYIYINGENPNWQRIAHNDCAYGKVKTCNCCGEYFENEYIHPTTLSYKGHQIMRIQHFTNAELVPMKLCICDECKEEVYDAKNVEQPEENLELTNMKADISCDSNEFERCLVVAANGYMVYLDTEDDALVEEANNFLTDQLHLTLKTRWRDIRLNSLLTYKEKNKNFNHKQEFPF